MYKTLCLYFCFIFPAIVHAQALPEEGSKLNYRLVGFKLPEANFQKYNYTLEIASGYYTAEDSFNRQIIKRVPLLEERVIAEVPYFGKQYTWRARFEPKGNNTSHKTQPGSPLYHFSTDEVTETDTSKVRLRILQKASKHKDGYVFLDGNRTLYDMQGNPVWFMRDIGDAWKNGILISDLKYTGHGTITFILGSKAYETGYNGNIVWQAPDDGKVSKDSSEYYHHELTRLKNGHYMVLGSETKWQFPGSDNIPGLDSSNLLNGKPLDKFRPVEFGTIIEYDQKGNVVWSWKSSHFFLDQDSAYPKPDKRYFMGEDNNFRHPNTKLLQDDVHENAFFFSPEKKVIYLSYKNMSQILKISYPEGKILAVYGTMLPRHSSIPGDDAFFCHQHSCRLSKDGLLYLYNNNICDTAPSQIIMLKEQQNEKAPLKKIWTYQCTVEGNNRKTFNTGGNVYELPDGCMFISMGSQYSKLLIVNRNKEILWSALPEKWMPENNSWAIIHQYRSSFISKEQMEDLIWNKPDK